MKDLDFINVVLENANGQDMICGAPVDFFEYARNKILVNESVMVVLDTSVNGPGTLKRFFSTLGCLPVKRDQTQISEDSSCVLYELLGIDLEIIEALRENPKTQFVFDTVCADGSFPNHTDYDIMELLQRWHGDHCNNEDSILASLMHKICSLSIERTSAGEVVTVILRDSKEFTAPGMATGLRCTPTIFRAYADAMLIEYNLFGLPNIKEKIQ